MSTSKQTYQKYTDETGETYYCPIDGFYAGDRHSDQAEQLCVESSIVGRYAGMIEVIEK